MATNETTIITETTDESGVTITEVATIRTEDAAPLVNDGEASLVEEVIEAILDENPDADITVQEYVVAEADSDLDADDLATGAAALNGGDVLTADEVINDFIASEVAAGTIDAADAAGLGTTNSDVFVSPDTADAFGGVAASGVVAEGGAAEPEVTGTEVAETAATEASAEAAVAAAASAEAAAHAEAAEAAQEAANEFIAKGDYAAAAEAREVAENESWEAGDASMLTAYDSSDLTTAAAHQETAEYHEAQQAAHAAAGDYEAAREDAGNAAYATSSADWNAGGADHTGQAEAEQYQMDWAVYEQNTAEASAQAAADYAADGDFENAEAYAADAVEHQAAADYHGDLGEHGGEMAVHDYSSEVETGGSYEAPEAAPAADYSSSYASADDGAE